MGLRVSLPVVACGIVIAVAVAGCGGALRLHDESKAKLATDIKEKYTQSNVLGALEVEKKNLDNLLAEELKVVRDNQRLRVDYALLSLADGGEPMSVTRDSGLDRLRRLGFPSPADARAARIEEIRLGATHQQMLQDARLIRTLTGAEPPACQVDATLPPTIGVPSTLGDTERDAVIGLYDRYRAECDEVKAAFVPKAGGALKEAEDEWKAARDEAARLAQSVADARSDADTKAAAHAEALKQKTEAKGAAEAVKARAEADARSALVAAEKARDVLKLVQARDGATSRLNALVVLLTAAAEGKLATAPSSPDLARAANVAKEIPSLKGDIEELIARRKAPSVTNLLVEMRHQVVLLEHVKQLQSFAQQRADILKARYDALREEARLWRAFHDAVCSYAELKGNRRHPGDTCDRFVVTPPVPERKEAMKCGVDTAVAPCALDRPWNEHLRDSAGGAEATRELYKALAAYLRALALQGTQHEQTFRVIDVHHREALAGREAALRSWDNLVAVPIDQLDAYYKALGFSAIAIGVAR